MILRGGFTIQGLSWVEVVPKRLSNGAAYVITNVMVSGLRLLGFLVEL